MITERDPTTTMKNVKLFALCATLIALAPMDVRAQTTVSPTKVFDLAPYGTTTGRSMALCGPTKEGICYSTITSFGAQGSTSAIYTTNGTSAPFKVHDGQHETNIEATDGNVIYHWSGSGFTGAYDFTFSATNMVQAVAILPVPPLLVLVPQHVTSAAKFDAQVVNGKLICAMDQGMNVGVELVSIPALGKPKTLVKDIDPGSPSGCVGGVEGSTCLLAGKMFFSAKTAAAGTELWTTDGTAAGTQQFSNFNTAAAPDFAVYKMVSIGSKIYLSASNVPGDNELWMSTAAPGSLTLLKDINPGTAKGSSPSDFTIVGLNVYFVANDGTNGRELWVTDGTAAGTRMVKDLRSGAGVGSEPEALTLFKGQLHFFAKDNAGVLGLYRTDGTTAGTALCHVLGSPNYIARTYTTTARLYYLQPGTKSTLWRTNGTAASLEKVLASGHTTGAHPYLPTSIVTKGNTLYFTADYFGTGTSFWKIMDPTDRK